MCARHAHDRSDLHEPEGATRRHARRLLVPLGSGRSRCRVDRPADVDVRWGDLLQGPRRRARRVHPDGRSPTGPPVEGTVLDPGDVVLGSGGPQRRRLRPLQERHRRTARGGAHDHRRDHRRPLHHEEGLRRGELRQPDLTTHPCHRGRHRCHDRDVVIEAVRPRERRHGEAHGSGIPGRDRRKADPERRRRRRPSGHRAALLGWRRLDAAPRTRSGPHAAADVRTGFARVQ